jgi:hypothetical protein
MYARRFVGEGGMPCQCQSDAKVYGTERPFADVILSGATASRSEAIAESKDPYPLHALIGSLDSHSRSNPTLSGGVETIGVLRLRFSIRKRMEKFRSG